MPTCGGLVRGHVAACTLELLQPEPAWTVAPVSVTTKPLASRPTVTWCALSPPSLLTTTHTPCGKSAERGSLASETVVADAEAASAALANQHAIAVAEAVTNRRCQLTRENEESLMAWPPAGRPNLTSHFVGKQEHLPERAPCRVVLWTFRTGGARR